jgi:hypothetical protein
VQSLHPPRRVVTSSVDLAAACALLIAALALDRLAISAQEQGARLASRLTNSIGMEFISSSRGYRPPESRLDAVGFRVLRIVP